MFLFLVIVAALAVAGAAAFFSVLGLIQTFAFTAVFWGTVIEAGKLVMASFLYRYWSEISFLWKTINIFIVIVLMLVTSLGIYGHLTASYQSDSSQLQSVNTRIELLEERRDSLNQRLELIDRQISEVPEAYVTKRMELIETFEPEKQSILNELTTIEESRAELKQLSIDSESKVGPIIFLAKALGKDSDIAIVWFTLFIVLVFDPLAVSLTLAANKVSLSSRAYKAKLYAMADNNEKEMEKASRDIEEPQESGEVEPDEPPSVDEEQNNEPELDNSDHDSNYKKILEKMEEFEQGDKSTKEVLQSMQKLFEAQKRKDDMILDTKRGGGS